jgi:hypothetical protein
VSEVLPVAAGLACGIGLIILFSVSTIPNMIPTTPRLTEDEVFDIMKADIQGRIGEATVTLYMRHPRNPDNTGPLPLIYFSEELGRQYGIDGKSHEVTYSCVPSRECPINIAHSGVEKSINGRLVYFLDGAYSGNEISSPAFYFIDAMNGDVLWSDIGVGEEIHPELQSE